MLVPEVPRRTFVSVGRRPQLGDEVADYIREAILSGALAAGAPLTIDGLARELAVSTTPVREALMALRGEGFVGFQPRRGFTAAPITLTDLSDLYWLQSEIAGELTQRASMRMDDDLLERLGRLQAGIGSELAARNLEEVESLNFQLHREINLAADAPKLLSMLRILLRYVPRRFFGQVPGWAEASASDHETIVAAMRIGDADAARRAMAAHIRHAGALLVENLRSQSEHAAADAG
jgi:DNA-binding GntR family transcriptional regulator